MTDDLARLDEIQARTNAATDVPWLVDLARRQHATLQALSTAHLAAQQQLTALATQAAGIDAATGPLAAAVAAVIARHHDEDGTCPTCAVAWPCADGKALQDTLGATGPGGEG